MTVRYAVKPSRPALAFDRDCDIPPAVERLVDREKGYVRFARSSSTTKRLVLFSQTLGEHWPIGIIDDALTYVHFLAPRAFTTTAHQLHFEGNS